MKHDRSFSILPVVGIEVGEKIFGAWARRKFFLGVFRLDWPADMSVEFRQTGAR
jgi:hypothetical protein